MPNETNQEEINPLDVVPDYETDLDSWGTNRNAEPPDGLNQTWEQLHPGGAKAAREKGLL